MIIAIDGLGVNGKTTLAKRISEKLNLKNFGAGAVYRCIALIMIEKNLSEIIKKNLSKSMIQLWKEEI